MAGTYQADALRVAKGLANQRSLTSTVFFEFPLSEQQELIAILGGYLYGNGSGSRDTGVGASLDVGFRYEFVRPYVSLEYFNSFDCPSGTLSTQCALPTPAVGATGIHLADSRNVRFGLDFYQQEPEPRSGGVLAQPRPVGIRRTIGHQCRCERRIHSRRPAHSNREQSEPHGDQVVRPELELLLLGLRELAEEHQLGGSPHPHPIAGIDPDRQRPAR